MGVDLLLITSKSNLTHAQNNDDHNIKGEFKISSEIEVPKQPTKTEKDKKVTFEQKINKTSKKQALHDDIHEKIKKFSSPPPLWGEGGDLTPP